MEATIDAPNDTAAQEAADALEDASPEAEGSSDPNDPDFDPDAYFKDIDSARQDEGASTGESSLPVAADASEQLDPSEIVIQGDVTQLAFAGFSKAVGGKKPTGSTVRLSGGAFSVEGGLTKGKTYTFEVTARVGEVGYADKVDAKTTQAVDCNRKHVARIVGASIVDAKTVERLDELHAAVQGFLAGEVPEARLAELVGVSLSE